MEMKVIDIYCDGGVKGNGGPGIMGFAAIGVLGDTRKEWSQAVASERATNIQAELLAIELGASKIKAALRAGTHLRITTDSEWSVEALRLQLGQPSKYKSLKNNLELVERVTAMLREFGKVEFIWVRGHVGHPENERCDELAGLAMATLT